MHCGKHYPAKSGVLRKRAFLPFPWECMEQSTSNDVLDHAILDKTIQRWLDPGQRDNVARSNLEGNEKHAEREKTSAGAFRNSRANAKRIFD